MTRAELKSLAKQQIKGNLGRYLLCVLILVALNLVLALIPVIGGFASIFVTGPLSLGFAFINLGMLNGKKIRISELFEGFNDLGRSVWLNILISLFTTLWSLLLFVPGIIKGLSYSMSFYILAENEDMTALQALNESKEIMRGHKWDLFVLYLSFIPWVLFGSITLGFGYIYVAPYINMTITNFYNDIKVIRNNTFIGNEF